MSPLCSDDRLALLGLARSAIIEAVCHARVVDVPPPAGAVAQSCGAFVTLHLRGRLRGCIGQVAPTDPLAATVVQCAIAAATKDPRFRPICPEELPGLEIELSILSSFVPIAPEAIEVGRHGLLVARDQQRGVLLPQVAAERGWGRERFLQESCVKAGLPPDAWKDPATQVMAFTAEVFSEPDVHAQQQQAS